MDYNLEQNEMKLYNIPNNTLKQENLAVLAKTEQNSKL